jgi:hypothetical protein
MRGLAFNSGAPGAACRRVLMTVLAGSFPVLLLLFATFFLLGRIGFWSDDYWHNLRDPVSGELAPLTVNGLTINRGFFIRPLFYKIVPPITTLAWRSQWPAHLLMTVAHGTVVLLLWRLMLILGARRPAAGAAALLFMVYPAHFEAVFWVSALPTTVASALMIVLMLLIVRSARAAAQHRTIALVAASVLAPAIAFTMCCLNEQPAMGVLALPLVYLAARRRGDRASLTLLRAGVPTLVAGVAVLLYTHLLLHDPRKPPGTRGSTDQLVGLSDVPARVAYFADLVWQRLMLQDFAAGAFRLGWREVSSAGFPGALLTGAVLSTGIIWTIRWSKDSSPPRTQAPDHPRPLLLLAIGACIFLAGWVPIFALAIYDPDSRTRYWPCIGLAMMLAGGGWLLGRSERASTRLRMVLAPMLLCTLLAGGMCMIGVQSAFRTRWQLDQEQGRQLRALIPNPEPLAFFVPLDIRGTGIRTVSPIFDNHFRSVFEYPWTAPRFIRAAYPRADIHCGWWRHWTPGAPVRGADENGIHFTDRLGPRFPRIEGSGSRIPWEHAVPFIIDENARVRLVTSVIIREPGKQDVIIRIPQTARCDSRNEPLEFPLPRS